jgi:enoyl-CoA hydratase/carnithine racemase
MEYEQILYGVANGVAGITLHRPDKLNAWTRRMEEEVVDAVRRASDDEAARVILLTGAGRAFCAGADMSLLSDAAAGGKHPTGTADFAFDEAAPPDLKKKYAWLLSVPKPIIAAVHGHCVGLGFVIACYCDIRIASGEAKFCSIFGKRGLVAEYGLAWMLPRLVGAGNAMELLCSSRMFDAAEALRLGLAQRVLPETDFHQDARTYAEEMAASVSPRSLRLMKRQVWDSLRGSLSESIDFAYREMLASFGTHDFKEGVAHYLEKRRARFTGK